MRLPGSTARCPTANNVVGHVQEPDRREHLWRLVRQLGEGLGVDACSPIVPLIVGSEAAAVAASAALLEKGFYVPAIRPPTVAPGTSRSEPQTSQ